MLLFRAFTCCSHKGLLHEVRLCSCICAEAAELLQLHRHIRGQQWFKALSLSIGRTLQHLDGTRLDQVG